MTVIQIRVPDAIAGTVFPCYVDLDAQYADLQAEADLCRRATDCMSQWNLNGCASKPPTNSVS